MMNFLTVFKRKYLIVLILLIFCTLLIIPGVSIAEEQEQWEKDLTACVNQNKAVSIHVTVDVSGSTATSDPTGLRGAATTAITLGLQKITKELQEDEYENVDMEISWSTFSNQAKLIFPWTNLSTSRLTKENLETYKSSLNAHDAGTGYIPASDLAIEMFNSKDFTNSCEIWIFMTDGGASDSYDVSLKNVDILKSRGTFLIGVSLTETLQEGCLNIFLNEVSAQCLEGSGVVFQSNSIYLKSKVFLAKDASDLLNAFLKISNQLRAAGFNQDKEDLDTEQTVICTENNECYYELSVGVGTQTAIIQMNVSNPGNKGDVELIIQPPPALNVADNLKTVPPVGINKTQFGDTQVEVEWYSDEVGIIKVDFDPNKNSWVGSWKFSLKANNPQGRNVIWSTTLFTQLVPKIPKDVPLRIGQEQCIEISYEGETVPPNAEVKLLVVNPSDGSIVKTIKAEEIPRGHKACLIPDESFPNKIKFQTEVIYEPASGKKVSADVATSNIIEILEAPVYNSINGPLNGDKKVFKGKQSVEYEFELQAGNIDSILNIDINQISANLSPNVNWYIEYKGETYQLGTEDFPIKVNANDYEIIKLIGDPFEARNLDTDTFYEINFKSSIPSISAAEEVKTFQINSRFLDVPFNTVLKYVLIIFLLFLLSGLLVSNVYSRINSGLVFDKNLRFKSYPVRILENLNIDFISDNFYEDSFDNTRILSTGNKKVGLSGSTSVQFNQKLIPFIQESTASIVSKTSFISGFNKSPEQKMLINPDINNLWVFEIESSNEESVLGNLIVVSNNEQTFNTIKDNVASSMRLINVQDLVVSTKTKKELKKKVFTIKESGKDKGKEVDAIDIPKTTTPPPGSGTPPSPPGSGTPPPPPPPGSGTPPPPPG